jgi:hypothetical protein
MTALTLYTIAASGSFGSTLRLGSTGGSVAVQTGQGTATLINPGWAQIGFDVSASGSGAGSIGSPNGFGGIFDGSTLNGKQIPAGNWSATLSFKAINNPTVGDLVVRFYKYNTSTTTYTSIGSITLSGQTIVATGTTSFNFPSTALPSMNFGSNETVYMDAWVNVTSLPGGVSGLNVTSSSSSTLGWTGSQIITPGYAASGNKSNVVRIKMASTKNKSTTIRTRIRTAANKSSVARVIISTISKKSASLRTLLMTAGNKSSRLRVRAGTLNIRSSAIRTRTNITNKISVKIRTIIRSTGQKSTSIRSKLSTLRNKASSIRIKARTTNRRTLAIRSLLRTAGNKSARIRTFVVTLSRRSTSIRLILRVPTGKYVINIAGNDVYVIAGTLSISNSIGRRSQASFMVRSDTSTHYQQYQQVVIYDKDGVLVFSGYITTPKEQKMGFQSSLIHSISCTDQHFLADKRVIGATYTSQNAGYIVNDIITNILSAEGVTVGQIATGPTIPVATFVYSTVAQALDELVKVASNSGISYYWMIDQNKQLWFVPYTAVVNSTLVDGSQIDVKNNPPTVQRQNPAYRNTQYVLGGVAQTSAQTETRKGDGSTQSWAMGYDLATVPTITVTSVAKTVGIKGLDTGKDFYWAKGDPIITQDSAGTVLTSSDTLQVVYTGQFPTVVVTKDAAQIAYSSSLDTSTGIIEEVEVDSSQTSAASAFSEASQLLTRYARQGTILQFTTLATGWAPGQLITVNLPIYSINSAQMLIEEVNISDQTDAVNIWYTVKAVLGPYDTTWVDFFSSLISAQQQTANSINIGASSALTLLESFTGSVSLTATGTLGIVSYSCPVPNTTLHPSTTLYPC